MCELTRARLTVAQQEPYIRRGMHRFILLALVLVGSSVVATVARGQDDVAAASAQDALRNAKNLFIYQDYGRAAEVLDSLLHPNILLDEADDVRIAREYLGASLWYLGRKDEARNEFTLLLLGASTHRLDPFQHVPEMISFYEALRQELIAQKAIRPDGGEPEDPAPRSQTIRLRRETIEKRPFVAMFIPFGVGQYQNGDTTLGTVFLVSEVLALSATIASYFLILDTRSDDPDRAKQYRTALWASEGVFLALVAGGITEAIISYDAQRTTVEELEIPSSPPPATGGASVRPMFGATPEGGLSFGVLGRF